MRVGDAQHSQEAQTLPPPTLRAFKERGRSKRLPKRSVPSAQRSKRSAKRADFSRDFTPEPLHLLDLFGNAHCGQGWPRKRYKKQGLVAEMVRGFSRLS